VGLASFHAYADGSQFFLAAGVSYFGNNTFSLPGGLFASLTGDYQARLNHASVPGNLHNPQNSSGLHLGSTDQLKKLIEQTSSSCRSAVQKLLNEIAAETGAEFTSTDPMELFNQITSQTGGGGIYVDITHDNMKDRLPADSLRAYTPISSGSGESWNFWSYSEKNVQRMSIVYLRYTNGTPKSIGLAMAAYLVTGIHEITHIARKDHKYVEHDQMNAAAVKLGAKSFDDYIEKNCVDKQYWGRP